MNNSSEVFSFHVLTDQARRMIYSVGGNQETQPRMASDIRQNWTDQVVTPAMAEHWLGNYNTRNRSMKKERCIAYSNDMITNNWTRGSRLIFYKNGTICDGQNRLNAVILSGETILFDILVGASYDEGVNVDTGMKRTASDCLKIAGKEEWIFSKSSVSIVNWLARWSSGSIKAMSHREIFEFATENEGWLQPVITRFKARAKKGLTSAGFYSQIALAYKHGVSLDVLDSFVTRYITGENYEPSQNSVTRLREYCLSNPFCWTGNHSKDTALRAQRAIEAFNDFQPLGKLYAPLDWIYVIPIFMHR